MKGLRITLFALGAAILVGQGSEALANQPNPGGQEEGAGVTASSDTTSTYWVIPAGREGTLTALLKGSRPVSGLILQQAEVKRDHVIVRYGNAPTAETRLHVTLRHPTVTSASMLKAGLFAIDPTPGPVDEALLKRLVTRLKGAPATGSFWQAIKPAPKREAASEERETKPSRADSEASHARHQALRQAMVEVREVYRRGDTEETSRRLSALVVDDKAPPELRLEVALLAAELGDTARRDALARTFPEDRALGEQGWFGPALRGALPGIEVLAEGLDDAGVCALRRLGDITAEAGYPEAAIRLYQAIMTRTPDCARTAERWGLTLIKLKRGEEAIEVLKPHQAKDPSDMRLTHALSHAYRMTDQLHESIRLFHMTEDHVARDDKSQYLAQLLALYLASSTEKQWVAHWRDVLAKDPDHITGRFLLGASLHYLNAFEESNEHLQKLVGIIDHEPRLYVYQAMNHFNLGDVDKARALLEAGTKLDKVDPDVYYCRAEVTRDTERDLAISDLERYLSLTSRSQFENPDKRLRVVSMRDALVECKRLGIVTCEGPWEHPRSPSIAWLMQYGLWLVGFLVMLLVGGLMKVSRRSSQAVS